MVMPGLPGSGIVQDDGGIHSLVRPHDDGTSDPDGVLCILHGAPLHGDQASWNGFLRSRQGAGRCLQERHTRLVKGARTIAVVTLDYVHFQVSRHLDRGILILHSLLSDH